MIAGSGQALTAPPDIVLDADLVNEVRRSLTIAGAGTGGVEWLSPGIACDIPFDGIPPGLAAAAVRRKLARRPVDIVAQPTATRRKSLLVADMDSTMITCETVDEIAAIIGIGDQIAEMTEQAMRGQTGFRASLSARVALLKGVTSDVLDQVFVESIAPTPGADVLVATMRAHGAVTALVSGGFTYFTERVAALLGFDEHYGNEVLFEAGRLTGEVKQPILGAQQKADILKTLMSHHTIAEDKTMAVGDGANDIEMLSAAGLGVAFHAKPAVATQAQARLNYTDLTSLLYIQGYRESEFRAGI